MDRKKLAAMSSIIGLASKIIAALMSFICRKFFLQYLGTDLLGISSTLLQVLDTLSLTELGFQTTIVFLLYRPLVEKNHEEVSKIMNLLKRVYFYIGILILIIGISVAPVLKHIITNVNVGYDVVYLVYFIMLAGTASSYFLSYNRALIQADQKIYITNLIDSIIQIIGTSLKIVSIALNNSIILYTFVSSFSTIIGNVLSYLYYKKYYTWIDDSARADKGVIKDILTKTKEVFLCRIGGYVYSSTDNLVISAFIGTRWVGLVGNYSTITNAIKMVIFGLTMPIQPMLGNFAVARSKEETEKIMLHYGFIRFTIAVFLVIPTMCLSDLFVELFYGGDYVLNPIITILLSIDLFIICMQGAIGELVDALGYFRQERKMYFFYALTNLSLSIIGAKIWGIIPVFVATVLSQLLGWIWRSVIAYKIYFKSKARFYQYWFEQLKYIAFFTFSSAIAFLTIKFILLSKSYLMFIVYGILIELIIMVMFIVNYRKKDDYAYMKMLLKKVIPKR